MRTSDQTEWVGPYKTEKKALDAVKSQYEVDDDTQAPRAEAILLHLDALSTRDKGTILGGGEVVAVTPLVNGTMEFRIRGARGDWFWDEMAMAKYKVRARHAHR